MRIARMSLWSKKTHTMDLDITPEQLAAWRDGMVIQQAMPHLTATEREFLISGMTQEEWEEMSAESDR